MEDGALEAPGAGAKPESLPPTPSRRAGLVVGAVFGGAMAVLAATISVATQLGAEPSYWTQQREHSARNLVAVTGTTAGAVCLVALGSWLVAASRQRARRRWILAASGCGAVLFAIACTAAVIDDLTAPPWIATGGSALLVAVAAYLLFSPAWKPAKGAVAIAAATTAIVLGGLAVTLPYIRHRIPPQELIDWWAAHSNPPIAFLGPLGLAREALSEQPRNVPRVIAACKGIGQMAIDFTGPPVAPVYVRTAVADLAKEISLVAERCESAASTITVDEVQRLMIQTFATEPARRYEDALNP